MLKVITLLTLSVTLASCQLMTTNMLEGVIDESVILPCRLQVTAPWYVIQWKKNIANVAVNIFTLTALGVEFNLAQNESIFYEVVSTRNNSYVQFDLKLKTLRCNDAGIYTCFVTGNSDLNSTTNLTLTVPMKKPHPVNQMEILKENVSVPLECEADVGFPHGVIYWYKKEPGDTAFNQIDVQPTQKLRKLGDCKWSATSILEVMLSRQQSGSIYKCAVQRSPGSSDMDRSADIVLTVLDENTTTAAQIVVICEEGDCVIEEEEDKNPSGSTGHRCSYLLLASTILIFKALVLRL